ncbi:hypothetical protein SCARD494_00495 [Seiridium cardinale]
MPAVALVLSSPLACLGTAISGDSIASTMLPLPAVVSIPSTPRPTEAPVDVSEGMNEQVVSTGSTRIRPNRHGYKYLSVQLRFRIVVVIFVVFVIPWHPIQRDPGSPRSWNRKAGDMAELFRSATRIAYGTSAKLYDGTQSPVSPSAPTHISAR